MVVNVYSVVLGTKKRMQQTFFVLKNVKHMDVIQNDTF